MTYKGETDTAVYRPKRPTYPKMEVREKKLKQPKEIKREIKTEDNSVPRQHID